MADPACSLNARMSAAPRRSPDSSPATRKMLSGRISALLCEETNSVIAGFAPDANHEKAGFVSAVGHASWFGNDCAACQHGDAGKTCARRSLDGLWSHRRQVESAVLGRLRRLDQHAYPFRRADTARAPQLRHAREQLVGA